MAMKLVDAEQLEADLTSVADSIRAKTGGEEKLAFPSGFESALDTIQSADSALAEVEYKLSNGYTDYSRFFYERRMIDIPYEILQHISSGTSFFQMFQSNQMREIEPLDTSQGQSFESMFQNNSMLKTIKGIDLTNATSVTKMLWYSSSIENITFNGVIKITGLDLSGCSKLTHDSLMSAINALYDYVSEGTTGTFKLTLGSTNLAKLTDAEKAIATQRGWTLA